ncbi:MAG TPA: molybdopterin-dependent oxidoreductase [Xanthobacteraceae bacterium]|nr:molybdopterin-dependent oxidoreductase [Xanthobacteraceae bacterium]
MRARTTATADAIVLCHLGVPRLDRDAWSLTVDGLVARTRVLRFEDLARYPQATVTSMHQCAGSPLQPAEPMRRICNLAWSGARLADILADCRPAAAAKFVWAQGADHGAFDGIAVDAYVKDFPIERAAADVLIAYELNGAPLPAEHGFPARLMIPGYYGTNSVKWLMRLTLAEGRARGPFTTRWYNDPVRDADGRDTGRTAPVWAIAPESVIVAPAADEAVSAAIEREIWGWAWADGGVRAVAVTCDDGASWQPAQLEAPRGREWQRFALRWTPMARGAVRLASRATSTDGARQPESGWRNAIHYVPVSVI